MTVTTKKTSTAKQQARATAESVKDAAERTGLAAPSTADVEKARKEGVAEAIKEDAKGSYRYATDGQQPGEPIGRQIINTGEHTNIISGLLALGPDDLKARVAEKAPAPLSEEQVANLLELERSGPNRTPHVEILCKRLKVKSPYEVTTAGPAYTNDVSNVTPVRRPGE
jgi:hypothetical protein